VRIHLRVVALLLVVAGIVGIVLSMTVLNTDEESPGSGVGDTLASGPTGPTGSTLDYAKVYPLEIDGPLLGVNLTAYTPDGYSQPSVHRAIITLKALGSNAITLVPTWYMNSSSANAIAPSQEKTPTDESLIQAIQWIKQSGMKVVLKPHVDVIDDSYRGDIQPSDRSAWFRSYGRFIDHYASFAASNNLNMLVVGTELKSLSSDTDPWRGVIQTVRDRFVGPITYAANWDEADQVQFWDDLDAIGVDAYYPLTESIGESPTLPKLVTAWRGIASQLKSLSDRWSRPVILTEVGYPSQVGATVTPYQVTDQPPDQNVQAIAYQATFDALQDQDWIKGISWWSWRADPGGEENMAVEYSPEGKRAQGELARGQFLYGG